MSIKIKLKKIWKVIREIDASDYNSIEPYIFSNQPSDEAFEDLIGMDAYVRSLKTAITSGNRMIGVLSEFGAGKSTLIKRLQRSYEDNHEKVKVVNINLWSNLPEDKVDATQLHKSFLYQFAVQINQKLGIHVNRWTNKGYGLIKLSTVNSYTTCLLIISAVIFVLSKLADEGILALSSKYSNCPKIGIILSVLLFVPTIFLSEFLFASPKFQAGREVNEEDFAELYTMIVKKAMRNGQKIVIVFEDIDRAKSPKVVHDFLTELHKIYLIASDKYSNISYIVNMKPEKLFVDSMPSLNFGSLNAVQYGEGLDIKILNRGKDDQEPIQRNIYSYPIYSKIFDYMIYLQPVNYVDLRYLLEKYIIKNKCFYLANNISVKDGNDNVDGIKGMLWLCFGEYLDIRGMKKRLNYANQLFYSLKTRFPGTNNISFEKCAIVAYLEDRYPDDFYDLQHDTIGEIIGNYISASGSEKTWENAIDSTITCKDARFASDLADFLKREQIDSGYRQYFYNYPKICVVRSYEEDKVYNIIINNKPLDEKFDSLLKIAIEKNERIVLETFKSIRLRGSSLPPSVFENEILLRFAINNEDKLVNEYLESKINILQVEALSALMKRISEMQICVLFHKRYSGIIGGILYKQLLDMEEPQVITYRKLFLLSVGTSVEYYRKLFVSDLPPISLDELISFGDPDIAMDIINSDKVDKQIVATLFEMVLKKPAYSPAYKKIEKLVKDTIGKAGHGFSDAFYAPILCKYMKISGRINGGFEKVITKAIRSEKFPLTEYITLINSIPVDRLHESTYKNIKELSIHSSLSEDICHQLLQRGLGLEYFANMRKRLDRIYFTGKIKDLFISSSKHIFDKYPTLFRECRQRLCAAIPKSIENYANLFKKPYPIIYSQELCMIDLTIGIRLVDASQLTDEATKDIASAFCREKRNASETAKIFDYVCGLRTYAMRATTFYALNFEQLSYSELKSEKKTQIINNLNNALKLSILVNAIEYMKKTHILDETLERVVLKKGNNNDYQNYGNMLFAFNNGTETTRQILINDRSAVRERPDFALQMLFEQKEYAIYIASLRLSKDKFIFEQEKIKELGEVYWQIYSGKKGLKNTRKAMLDNEDLIKYIYDLDREFTTEEEYLMPFSTYPQTDKLLDALCSCSLAFVKKYVMATKQKLNFSGESVRQRLINNGLSNDDWVLDKDIRRTLYNACLDKSEKKNIATQLKKIKRAI